MKDHINKNSNLFPGHIFQGNKNFAEEQFDEVKPDSYSNQPRIMKRRKLKGKVRSNMNLIK